MLSPEQVETRQGKGIRRTSNTKFTEEEDMKLIELGKQYENGDTELTWPIITAKIGTTETVAYVAARYNYALKSTISRGKWTASEDSQIREMGDKEGKKDWAGLAAKFGNRTGKQVRERWLTLSQSRAKWTEADDHLLVKLTKEHGPKWTFIATKMSHRTATEVKNRWHSKLKKQYETIKA